MKTIGEKVRFWREKKGITLRELASKSGLHFTTISKIEHGERPNPGITTLQQISSAMGISLDKLLNPPKGRR